jgi:hypothetical protein
MNENDGVDFFHFTLTPQFILSSFIKFNIFKLLMNYNSKGLNVMCIKSFIKDISFDISSRYI